MNTYKDIFFRLILLLSLVFALYSCATNRIINYNDVTKGNHLDKIPEINLDTFLSVWIKKSRDKKGESVSELYKDSVYRIFWDRSNFYKVKNDTLALLDYKLINGDSIRDRFFDEIIPAEDKEKGDNCSSYITKCDFTYRYIRKENSFEIKCNYKITCEFLIRVINKNYSAYFDINKNTFR